jgi:hypothetical protein
MPRIIVTTDAHSPSGDAPVLLDEHVRSVHLSTGHASAQLVERLGWAISDAELAEGLEAGAQGAKPASAPPRVPAQQPRTQPRPRRRRGSTPSRPYLIGAS